MIKQALEAMLIERIEMHKGALSACINKSESSPTYNYFIGHLEECESILQQLKEIK